MPPQTVLLRFFITLLDSLFGYLILVCYLLAVTDERQALRRLKKLPALLLAPLLASLTSLGLYAVSDWRGFGLFQYFLTSALNLVLCTFWTAWAWRLDRWRAFSAVCMAAILQVATSALAQTLFLFLPEGLLPDVGALAAALLFSIAAAALLGRLRFGAWFRLLLEDRSGLRRTAALLFALLESMETFLILQNGVGTAYLAAYYLLAVALAAVILGLIVNLARSFDSARTVQVQRDVIAQQQLYEQDLEAIRQEVRAFRHDYKNLLAGLAREADEETELRAMLAELDEGFDRQLGERIRLSAQIGNLRVPQLRSLLLNKLALLREKGADCRLEVLYPVESVGMDVWDFVRCLGVLLDNAAEAALETPRPWVEAVLLSQGGRLYLRVSNPYAGAVDPGRMWERGWSTKGAGRGLGLSSYRGVLERYPNASPCTGWEDGVFVQELTVEDRP